MYYRYAEAANPLLGYTKLHCFIVCMNVSNVLQSDK